MRHSSFLEVRLDLLGENVQKIQGLAPGSKLIPMVKADAYGNGLLPVSRFLIEECGVQKLGCASLGEALRLFEECPKLEAEVLVFSDIEFQDERLRSAYLNYNITPVISRASDLRLFLKTPEFKKIPLALKLNTGMNRLGLSRQELEAFIPQLKSHGVQHLLTHFATSYYLSKQGDKTSRQYDEFLSMKKLLMDAGVAIEETSVANSGAIEQGIGINESYIRPGLMMYGPHSVEPCRWAGHQVSRLVTRVLKTFPLKQGTPVGYGIHVAPEDLHVVVLALGYGDGLMTYASGSEITLKGHKGKIFARVNMDMAFVAFPPAVAGKFEEDEAVEIWNHDPRSISDLSARMKTIPYQLMCGISGRIPRIYKVK